MANFPYPDENVSGIMEFLQYVNSLTDTGAGGLLGIGILIIVGFVSFLSAKAFGSDKALGFSAFLILIVSILLRFMNLINDATLFICIVIFVGGFIYLIRERRVEEVGG